MSDIEDPVAYINVTTVEGELVKRIEVTPLDHINLKDYLNDVYQAVNDAARLQGVSL